MIPRYASLLAGFLGLFWGNALAADKSGVGPNTISVPKGPGSIEGMGEAFQPTLNTGTAKHGIPFSVPPGTAGHTPSVGLSYEGGSGNGPVGFGWRMTVPYIQRQTEKGIPRYVDADNGIDDDHDGTVDEPDERDRFFNETKEELVPLANGDHFTENEGGFVRYRKRGEGWEGTLPDGTVMLFGATTASQVKDGNTTRVFRWLLESSTDTRGNTIRFIHADAAGPQNLNQKYLERIEYGPGSGPWTAFHFVQFSYEDRSDWFEDCRPGFPLRTGRRLKSVAICTQGVALPGHQSGDRNADGSPDYLNRRYDMAYFRYAGADTHWSYLESVTLFGADGTSSLPPARYGYSVCHPPATLSASGKIIGEENAPIAVMDNPLVDLLDLNGDGLPDILKTTSGGGAHSVAYNKGEKDTPSGKVIVWASPSEVASSDGQAWGINLQSGAAPGEAIAHLADMDADGTADLVYHTASNAVYYFKNRYRAGWGDRLPMAEDGEPPPSPFGDPNTKTADVDFDKRMDIIQSQPVAGGADYRIWYNLGGQRYSEPVTVSQIDGMLLSQTTVSMADWNGDRMSDMVRIRPATLEITAAWGHGRFSPLRSVTIPDGPLSPEQVAKASLRDITGDGLADLVVEKAEPGVLWYWINQGTDQLAPRRVITGLPTGDASAAIRWADLNGNTTTDYIIASGFNSPAIQVVDLGTLLGCVSASSLMNRIENGIGRVTTVEYSTSSQFALADAAAGVPWTGPVPFPVSVVSMVRTSDSLGHSYLTEFHYHDGYYDGAEQEFRGFGRAEQVDIGDATAPTLVTRSYFDTGRAFKALKGKLLRLTAETTAGAVFNDQTTQWTVPPVTLYTGTNGQAVQYAHPTASVKLIKELGQGVERRMETESGFDNYGNQTRSADFGIVENGNRAAFDDERIVTTKFAINTAAWIIHLPQQREVADENGNVISRSAFYYDDPSFAGGNAGTATRGELTLAREWINPAGGSTIDSARTRYDDFGNPESLFDPLGTGTVSSGHARQITYDPAFHSYPVTETIHLGNSRAPLVFEAAYDKGLGAVTGSTDFNGNATAYQYDPFARLTAIIRPGDTAALPTAEYDYVLASPFGAGGLINYVETRQIDKPADAPGDKRGHYAISRQFIDGLGRKLLSKQEAEAATPGGSPRVTVKEAVTFNARLKPVRVLNPFFTTQGGGLDAQLAFESIEAPGWTGQFALNGQMVALSLATAHASRTDYDAALREATTINPDGASRHTIYEPLLTRSFDENDSDPASPFHDTPMVHFNDGLGRLVRVDEISRLRDDGTPAGALKTWTTRYEYDLNDQLTKITDSQNNVKLMAYDGLKRKTFMNDPDRGVMSFVFDAASNLSESTDAKGQRITYTYDGANRILTEDYHDESLPFSSGYAFNPQQAISAANRPDVAYFYDRPLPNLDVGDGSLATAANTKGKLAFVWDLSGEEHTSYDARDRVGFVVKRVRDPLHGQLVSYRTGFTYDSLDRLTGLLYPDNDAIGYQYNDRSLLSRISGGPTGSIISSLGYLPSDQQADILYGNGVQTRYTYDSRLRLNSLVTAPQASPASPLIAFGYDFDGVSNIKSITDNRPGSVVPAGDKRRNTQHFQYDDLYRITRAQYSFALPGSPPSTDGEIQYRYDRIGNMLAQTSTIPDTDPHTGLPVANLGEMDSGGSIGRANRTGRAANDPPGPHALSSIRHPSFAIRAFPYDPNGNMTNLDGMVATWDFKDRLVALEDATMRAEYAYDFTDRRITKQVTKKSPPSALLVPWVAFPYTTIYVGKHFEVREFDAPTKFVFNGNTRVARVTGSLSSNQRVQRLRVNTGWNLVSIAVTAPNTLAQLSILNSQLVVQSAFKWNPATRNFTSVSPAETIPAGSVLWLQATTNTTLRLTGAYPGPTPNLRAPPEGDFLPSRGLEIWPLSSLNSQPSTSAWHFASDLQRWQSKVPLPNFTFSDLPSSLAPHEALYAQAPAPADLEVPNPALSLRFYHQDHLGSSSVISDAAGALVEESANYAFGCSRNEFRPRRTREDYQFTQKERDVESGLHYFEARFMSSGTGGFASVDPLCKSDEAPARKLPQLLNNYRYAVGRPVGFNDPTGKSPNPTMEPVGTAGAPQADLFKNDLTRFIMPGVASKYTAQFGQDDPYTKQMQGHPYLDQVRSEIASEAILKCSTVCSPEMLKIGGQKGNGSTKSQGNAAYSIYENKIFGVSLGDTLGEVVNGARDLGAYVLSYGNCGIVSCNPNLTKIGSFNSDSTWSASVDCKSGIANVEFDIKNTLGFHSLTHLFQDNPFGKEGIFGNVKQEWKWNEHLNFNSPYPQSN
jgi:RHS repeat-associated protein